LVNIIIQKDQDLNKSKAEISFKEINSSRKELKQHKVVKGRRKMCVSLRNFWRIRKINNKHKKNLLKK